MRELRRKAVYAYQFIPLRRGTSQHVTILRSTPRKGCMDSRFCQAQRLRERHRARSSGIGQVGRNLELPSDAGGVGDVGDVGVNNARCHSMPLDPESPAKGLTVW